jgi:ABC-type tungstate transport system permease subunit
MALNHKSNFVSYTYQPRLHIIVHYDFSYFTISSVNNKTKNRSIGNKNKFIYISKQIIFKQQCSNFKLNGKKVINLILTFMAAENL